ncbi:hypothetical protein AQUCO_01800190v1 [Aquilegia coerulea]|uniref:Uncharacterized protein n=1 Tax=Aquilegia coerulea TaxID=218851 RepID=A0A2G5DKB3_AQUCA|nr:hypothetical protein AQUCO_01800190v1 [Aquilegia coerulea]
MHLLWINHITFISRKTIIRKPDLKFMSLSLTRSGISHHCFRYYTKTHYKGLRTCLLQHRNRNHLKMFIYKTMEEGGKSPPPPNSEGKQQKLMAELHDQIHFFLVLSHFSITTLLCLP